jgi:hypothetical protein
VRARLESAVERCAPRPLARIGQGHNLGVRSAGALVSTAADNYAVSIDNDRPNHRIGTRAAATALGEAERTSHVVDIG